MTLKVGVHDAGGSGRFELVVHRDHGGDRDGLNSYVIEVDGQEVVRVASGEAVTVSLHEGEHWLRARRRSGEGSKPLRLIAERGQQVHLDVGINPTVPWWSLTEPLDNALTIRPSTTLRGGRAGPA